MWKYIRIIVPLLIIAFVVPMIMPGPDGKPIMSIKDWVPDKNTLTKIEDKVKEVVNNAVDATVNASSDKIDSISAAEPNFIEKKNQLYKWKDKNGRWQFTNRFDQVPEYALSQLQAEQMPQVINTMAAPAKAVTETAEASKLPMGGGQIGIDKLPQLVEEANKAKAMMEERNKKLEQL
jgi:hypothetical protein